MEPASKLIDRITYTASLATNKAEIDPMLDTLREITSRVDVTKPLEPPDLAKLQNLQQQLEAYLVQTEKLRLFTADSLSVQIEQHVQGRTDKKSVRRLWFVLAVATAAAVSAATLLPLGDAQQRAQVGGATMFSLVTVGAGWLFLTALPAFKTELRRAFLVICAGVMLLGLSLLEQPIMEIFKLRQYPIVSLLYPLPILLAATLFHVGDALYVRLVGAKNKWTTAWPVLLAAVVFSAISWFLPHPATTETELVHDIAAVIWASMIVLPLMSAVILPMAMRRLPEVYRTPATRLWLCMFPILAVCVYQYVVRIVAGPYMQGPVAYTLFSLVFFMGLSLLLAGYSFNKVSRY